MTELKYIQVSDELKHISNDCAMGIESSYTTHTELNWLRGIKKRVDALIVETVNQHTALDAMADVLAEKETEL